MRSQSPKTEKGPVNANNRGGMYLTCYLEFRCRNETGLLSIAGILSMPYDTWSALACQGYLIIH